MTHAPPPSAVELPPARGLLRAPVEGPVIDRVRLDYEGRFLRRRRLTTAGGARVLVDLAETVSLDDGDALVLEDGGLLLVEAADEPLLIVRGDLARLAWHIGNRHTPCRIEADRLLLRQDPVLAAMLKGLGATIEVAHGPFAPERGAYGHGRTLAHSHGPAHDHHHHHDHDHGDGHGHDHHHG